MQICDIDNLIPDHALLLNVLATHPLDASLTQNIKKITIQLSEQFGFLAQENILSDIKTGEVVLGVGRLTAQKPDYHSILYHEFSHVADKFSSRFDYSEQLKQSLTRAEQACVMEIWNVYINSRLNAAGRYCPSGQSCKGTLNGIRQDFPSNVQGDLMVHRATLEREGFAPQRAKEVIEHIWDAPGEELTYPRIVLLVKEELSKRMAVADAQPPH